MIDFRSDTITKPTKGMLEAMMNAPLGDDVFVEDPTVNALEDRVARDFGMEAALFCPSGTMTNQIAIKVHTVPGDEVICSQESHIYCYEAGGIAFNSGCSVKLIPGASGLITAESVRAMWSPENVHFCKSTLVSVENTSNRGGGVCYDFSELRKIKEVCEELGMKFHLDGARVYNAIVKNGESPKAYGEIFDSISICLSKGLGAPIGSVLLGSKDFIHKARRVRKVFGGGMRQVGLIAAAADYALTHHVERLAEDHARATQIANAAKECGLVEDVVEPETNIVVMLLKEGVSNESFLEKLTASGVLGIDFGPGRVRLTTHLDLSQEDIDRTCEILRNLI